MTPDDHVLYMHHKPAPLRRRHLASPSGTDRLEGVTMTGSEVVTITGREHALERPTSHHPTAAAPVLVAAWCRSVGTFWTLELHRVDGGTAAGTIVDWITSGVPISQPVPQTLTRELLAERGLHLFEYPSADPGTQQHRHRIGYVCADPEVIKLAHLVRDDAPKAERHPVALATQWIAAGFSANVAAGWIRQGIHSPHTALQQAASLRVTASPTHTTTGRPPSRLRYRAYGLRGTAAPRNRRCPCRRGR